MKVDEMSLYYLPGCHFTELDPRASKALVSFAKTYLGAHILGCCSKQYDKPQNGDTVIYVCPTCALIMAEANPSVNLVSLYELIEDDSVVPQQALSWVNLQGKEVTVQDCWRSSGNLTMQQAVRHVLSNMNATVYEMEDNFEKTTYCGTSLLSNPSARYEALAPSLFNNPIFRPTTEADQIEYLEQHAKQYRTAEIICYCTGCIEGIETLNASRKTKRSTAGNSDSSGVYKPIHLASLVAQSLVTYPS